MSAIQIQLPAELAYPPAASTGPVTDITPGLTLLAFAIALKVTLGYLKSSQ